MGDVVQTFIDKDYQKSLSNIAKIYAGIGYSVIPIFGDRKLDKAKVAAVSWKLYQTRRASDEKISQWFERDHYGGVAIVTGRISNLVVIDFDDPDIQAKFERQFPDLLKTRVVISASRGLKHYYYAVSQYVRVPTLHMNGVDLLSNGGYIIAPPTLINDNEYRVEQGGMPYQLTTQDAQRIEKFFRINCEEIHKYNSIIDLPEKSDPIQQTPKAISPESLIRLYRHYAPQIGRNNALFKIACHARDHHMSVADVEAILSEIHAHQPDYQLHIPETEKQRLQEASRTITSAFRRPPRPIQESTGKHLTNSIREALLKSGLTCVARVLDGLFLKGFASGDVVTKKMVTEALNGVVGRHSILGAFDAHISGAPIFESVFSPPSPLSVTHVANGKANNQKQKCFLYSQSKSDKTPEGRIPTQFVLPDINALCHLLGVPFTRSDPMTLEDIRAAKIYRQAVHRELIKRRPGMYHRWWLAQRLGVSRRTSQRYDHETEVKKQPMYIYEPITWNNLGKIPAEDPINGMFLEDETGKRYPGLRQIAAKLLAQKHRVRYAYQDVNYYWVGDRPLLSSLLRGINPRQEAVDIGREKTANFIKQYWRDFKDKTHVQSITPEAKPKPQTQAKSITTQPPIIPMQSNREHVTPSMIGERVVYLAECLYKAVWDRATNEKSRLSKVNARKLVETYGDQLIRRVLGVLKYRSHVYNPAGFVTMWLRSTAKVT